MVNRIKDILLILLFVVFAVLIFRVLNGNNVSKDLIATDTLKVVVYDTIPYYKPVPKEEKPLGNIVAKLSVSVPKLSESGKKLQDSVEEFGKSVSKDHFEDRGEMVIPDSADVVIPITQKVYEDSTYTAYVSGYRASLDSLIFRIPREVITLTNPYTQKPKRWSVGIQLGYGITMSKGTPQVAPYVGIGVSYSIFSF